MKAVVVIIVAVEEYENEVVDSDEEISVVDSTSAVCSEVNCSVVGAVVGAAVVRVEDSVVNRVV